MPQLVPRSHVWALIPPAFVFLSLSTFLPPRAEAEVTVADGGAPGEPMPSPVGSPEPEPPAAGVAPILAPPPAPPDRDEVVPPSDSGPLAAAPPSASAPSDDMTIGQAASSRGAPPEETPSLAGFPTLPSLTGSLGLLHASSAEVGPRRQLRVGLHGQYFGADNFLVKGDSNQRLAGELVVGYTLRRDIELFGALLSSSNRNQRGRELGDRDPEFIKTFGDLLLGGKWILPLSPAVTFGVELGVKFLSGVSDLLFSLDSTSWWLGPLFTLDLRRLANVPLRFHAGASFYADNSYNLHQFAGATRATKEAAMFGYGMAPSRLRGSLAVDAPIDNLVRGVSLVPFLEYHVAYVTADADRDFQDYMIPSCADGDPSRMPCVSNRDMQFLTAGMRTAVYRGLTVDLGVDIRMRSPGFPYGPPLPPFNVIFGVSYPLDLDSLTRTVVLTRIVEPPVQPRPERPALTETTRRDTGQGHIEGTVRSADGGLPIAGAIVAVTGRARARAASDSDGGFATANLQAGPVELEVTAADFVPARLTALVSAGQSTDLQVQLVPSRSTGQLSRVDGPAPGQSGKIDPAPHVPAPGGEVTFEDGRISMKNPIRFVGATANLTPASEKLLDQLAALLEGHPEVQHVRIVAHWDASLAKAQSVELTRSQAEKVRGYLVARGIADARLAAAGEGSQRPLVPNLSPANRSRNRRVEFRIE